MSSILRHMVHSDQIFCEVEIMLRFPQLKISKKLLKESNSLELDLGNVQVIAEVILNGENLGILWKAPFRINIDNAVKIGTNILEVKVTNLWPNRLIDDEGLPLDYQRIGNNISLWPDWLVNPTERPTNRSTFPAYLHWHKDSELLLSGMFGPVRIVVYSVEDLVGF